MNFSRRSVRRALRGCVRRPLAPLAAALLAAGCAGDDPAREAALARAAFDAGDWNRAEVHFSKQLELAPGNADAAILLAQSRFNLGRLDDARKALSQISPQYTGDADARLLSANISFFEKEYDAARSLFLEIANDQSLDAKTRAEGFAGAGATDCFLACTAKEDPDGSLRARARTELLTAMRLDRRNPSAHYHLAILYRDSYRYIEAAKDEFGFFTQLAAQGAAGKRVQDVQHRSIPALKNEIAAKAAGRPGAANRNSVQSTAILAKADALAGKGNFAGAAKLYAQALETDCLSHPAATGLAKTAARAARNDGERKKALEAYITASSLDPYDTKTAIAGAELAGRLGRWATAAALYSRAVAATPASKAAVDGLAAALEKSGNRKTAEIYRKYRARL